MKVSALYTFLKKQRSTKEILTSQSIIPLYKKLICIAIK